MHRLVDLSVATEARNAKGEWTNGHSVSVIKRPSRRGGLYQADCKTCDYAGNVTDMTGAKDQAAAHRAEVPRISASDLSTPDARRSPEVSPEEFDRHARRGKQKLDALSGAPSLPNALKNGAAWNAVVAHSYKVTREKWGGATIDAHTGEEVRPDADAYALTMRPPGMEGVKVDPASDLPTFTHAMAVARDRYKAILRRPGSHLGVFHDADTGEIDIDPVLVTPNLADVHDIGAYTHAVGGAYHFKSGDGYWPPHVKG